MPLATIGYEKSTLDDVIAALKRAGVEVVIDVRQVPNSRKPGFSKRMLAASLEAEGIDYVHLRGLGTPKEGREAAKRGDVETLDAIYRDHLQQDGAQADLDRALEIAREKRACLLCFERDHAVCHRDIVVEKLLKQSDFEILHLEPGWQPR